jgi:hypothetical protein
LKALDTGSDRLADIEAIIKERLAVTKTSKEESVEPEAGIRLVLSLIFGGTQILLKTLASCPSFWLITHHKVRRAPIHSTLALPANL